jgi:hypothetical protein
LKKSHKLLTVAVAMALAQYGCGGGDANGDRGVTSPVMEAQGFYTGGTSKNQSMPISIMDDGSFYALYVVNPGNWEVMGC